MPHKESSRNELPRNGSLRNALPRKIALDILMHIDRDQGYSNIALDAAFEKLTLDGRDTAFVTSLVYGVLEQMICLDYMISHFARRDAAKMQPKVRSILRLGAYQLMFMDKIPARSAVDESVKLAKSAGCAYASGFVNAVMRAVSANLGALPYPDQGSDPIGYLTVRYACPRWLVEKWLSAYGKEKTLGLLQSLSGKPPAAARVNTLKISTQALIGRLAASGITAAASPIAPDAILFDRLPDLRRLPEFQEGLFIIQDYASQLCCRAVGAQPGETVLDLCAAPGGKSFTMGFMMQGRGKITACELYESRLSLIREGARRLGLDQLITPVQNDASRHNEALGYADRVLCDVPCSGLGAIRRKPEIRYKNPETFDLLPDLQYIILCEGSAHVAPGGRLVYSTCTLNPDENERVVERFLHENPSFTAEPLEPAFFTDSADAQDSARPFYVTLFPQCSGTDGFFIATLRKKA